jgi:tetratricopeptide (TPR) repeat protein
LDTAASHLEFAIRLNDASDYQGAQGELLRSLSLEPRNLDARRVLAPAHANNVDHEYAVLEYYKVLLSAPDNVDVHIALGRLLLERDDKEADLKHFQMAVKYASGSTEARGARPTGKEWREAIGIRSILRCIWAGLIPILIVR